MIYFSSFKCINRKPPAAQHYLADGTGRDWYILANHGGFINKYKDTGDAAQNYSEMLRTHNKLILKNTGPVSNSPIMSPRSYKNKLGAHVSPKEAIKKLASPRKNFETNLLPNGMNPWYH